jgi:leucyl-tRNA synthetase
MSDRTYQPADFEQKWRDWWAAEQLYRTPEGRERPKYYGLEFFPYPSGEGLSVGHLHNYVPCDAFARYKRLRGYDVLHPMGWDAFGLPAENEAILKGRHPHETVVRYAAAYKRQLDLVGCDYDWQREIITCAPDYYTWTQWVFLLLYSRGLAYRATGSQWWCEKCKTILANEQVENGACWRHSDTPVARKELEQWYLRITDYADELLSDLDQLDWPAGIKLMQRNWIGRSEGVRVRFPLVDAAGLDALDVFTTRPDTLYGVTFIAVSPEHPQLAQLVRAEQRAAVNAVVRAALRRSAIERMGALTQPLGSFTGSYVRHPLTGEPLPVWVGDYVLSTYATGVVMGVPAHDQRDWDFAQAYGLPIRQVIAATPDATPATPMHEPLTEPGYLVASGPFSGQASASARAAISAAADEQGWGTATTTYRMRDWLISRQRYWGPPIPIIYCDDCGIVPVPEQHLPVLLPRMAEYVPAGDGRSPLANNPDFVNTVCPRCGGPARRETDTIDGFLDSSWYFLRYPNPHEPQHAWLPAQADHWLPVDLYVGGAEHAVMHLLYVRFCTKVFYDAGLVKFREPFPKLRNQGSILHPDGKRMSKSRGNVITPEEVVAQYGADATRLFILSLGPLELDYRWSSEGINGMTRFLRRIWQWVQGWRAASPSALATPGPRERSQCIQQMGHDIEGLDFHTALAALISWHSYLQKLPISQVAQQTVEELLILLAPMAPFLAEELWHQLGHSASVHRQQWPSWSEADLRSERCAIVVQVNGRRRGLLELPTPVPQGDAVAQALALPKIVTALDGKPPARIVYVQDRLLNLVTDGRAEALSD